MIKKLRWKFVLIVMVLLWLMMAAISVFFIITTRDSLYEDSVSVLQRVISETETPSWSSPGADGVSLPYFTVLIDPHGGAMLTSSQFYSLDDRDYLIQAVNAALEQENSMGLLKEYNLRYLRQASNVGWRLAFVDISYERSTLNRTVGNTLLVSAGALAVFFLLSLILSKWATDPAEKAWEQQRQFVADASHELKTPLTVILSNTELLERNAQILPERDQRRLRNIRMGGSQMESLVEELLILARSDNRKEGKIAVEPVDLTDLVQSAVLMLEAAAYEAGLKLECGEMEPGLIVLGNADGLKRLLDILLENALKYTKAGGRITVSLRQEGRRLRLEVANEGTPIAKEELEAIFRRFYRGDSARTSQGFGLGLAIARSVAQEHKGKLWAESDPAGINTFICTLPASAERP